MREPNGWKGVIEHGAGTSEIHPWEAIVFENSGVYIYHNDKYDTVSFLPIFTIREVRWHDASKEEEGRNVGGKEWLSQKGYHEKMQALQAERKAIGAVGTHEEESE